MLPMATDQSINNNDSKNVEASNVTEITYIVVSFPINNVPMTVTNESGLNHLSN